MTSRLTLPDVINTMIERKLSEVHTCLPAKIVKYDYETQKATVQPLIKKVYLDDEEESLPLIVNVPVIWPRTQKTSLTFPIEVDDYVMLLFSERSLELFLEMGKEQKPGDTRMFDLTDAIAIPGLYPFSAKGLATNNDDVLLVYDKSSVRIKRNGDFEIIGEKDSLFTLKGDSTVEIDGDSDVLIKGQSLIEIQGNTDITIGDGAIVSITGNAEIFVTGQTNLTSPTTNITGNVNINGALTVSSNIASTNGNIVANTGDVLAQDVSLHDHTHGGVEPGGGNTLPPN